MNYKKTARKVFKKARGYAIKRYFNKGYKPKISRIVKDVSMLKNMINAEKKRYTQTNSGVGVGQMNVNSSGHYLVDITPNPSQGVGYDQKTGASIKWTSSYLSFQFQGQANTFTPIKVKMYFIKVFGTPLSNVSDIMGKFILPNQWLSPTYTFYDFASQRDVDYFKNYRVIKTQTVYIPLEDYAAQTQLKTVNIGLRPNIHVKTNNNDPTLSSGQILLLIVADNGNCGTSNGTATSVPTNTSLSGLNVRYNFTHYFLDN